MMLKEERQKNILALLHNSGKLIASDLSRLLQTSEDTIRRDLRELDDAGLLLRVHGGALPRATTSPDYITRQGQGSAAKDAIGRVTAGLLRSGQVILLDGGTTALYVAQHLPADLRATVVTNSVPAMSALALHPGIDMVMLGGRFFREGQVAVGAQTVAALRLLHADVCVSGVSSVHPEVGISALNYEEADVKRAMVAACTELIVVAAADKLGKVAPYVIAPMERASVLVTEQTVAEDVLAPYRAAGVSVVTG